MKRTIPRASEAGPGDFCEGGKGMEMIHTVIQNGKIIADAPPDMADGTPIKFNVEVDRPETEKWGMDESEWRDDPEAIEEWCRWIDSLEPIDFPPEDDFDRKFREFQIEAVRRQMEQMDRGEFP